MNEITVLLVEYDESVRKIAKDAIEALIPGVKVVDVDSACRALELDARGVNVVVSDWDMAMPGEGGLVACHFSKLPRPIPVLVTSGGQNDGPAMRAGATQYLEKPYHINDLVVAIRELSEV